MSTQKPQGQASQPNLLFHSLVLDSLPMAVVVQDQAQRVVYANKALYGLFGCDNADIIGRPVSDFFDAATAERISQQEELVLATGGSGRVDFEFKTSKGKNKHLTCRKVALDAPDGQRYVLSVLRDVTQAKRVEAELENYQRDLTELVYERTSDLQRSNEQLKRENAQRREAQRQLSEAQALLMAAIDNSPAGIVIADAPDVSLRIANQSALEWSGDADDRQRGRPVANQFSQVELFDADGNELRPEDLPIGRAVLHGETVRNAEVMARQPDGTERLILANAAPVRDDAGEITAGVVVFIDITERKAAEKLLRQSEEKFRRLAETAAVCIYIYQGEMLQYVNAYTEKLTGYSREELAGMSFYEVVHPDWRGLLKSRHRSLTQGEFRRQRLELKVLTRDGQERWVEDSITPIELGGEPAVLGIAVEITERKRAEEELQRRAFRDSLTGLANRALFMDRLERALSRQDKRPRVGPCF